MCCRAEVPTEHMKDAKAMAVEKNTENDGHETAEDLYNALPVIRPLNKGQLTQATNRPGHCSYDHAEFEARP